MSWLKRLLLGGSDATMRKGDSLTKLLKMNTDAAAKEGGELLDANLLTRHHQHHAENIGSGLSTDSLRNIMADVKAGVSPEMGGKNITGTGNILTSAFNTDGGPAGAMLMGGVIGGIAAGATDNNFGEGAVIGGLVGGGIKAIGTGIAKDIEKKFIGDLLGDSAGKFSIGSGKKAIASDDLMNIKAKDIPDEYLNLSSNKAMGYTDDTARPMTFGDIKSQSSGDAADFTLAQMAARNAPMKTAGNELFPEVRAGASIRQQQLAAIGEMDDVALAKAGRGAEFKKDFLTGKSRMNVGQVTRMAGFAGSALSGMAFSSKQRDYRRGFNKKRGNRV